MADTILTTKNASSYITDRKNATSSTLKEINDISDHDPLGATLTVRFVPALTISYYNNVNNKEINCPSDLVIFCNAVDTKLNIKSLSYKMKMTQSTPTSYNLYYKHFKLYCHDEVLPLVHEATNNKIYIFNLKYYEVNDGLNLSIAFRNVEATTPDVHLVELFKYIEGNISSDLLIVMGECPNVPIGLPPHGKLIHNDKCFIA